MCGHVGECISVSDALEVESDPPKAVKMSVDEIKAIDRGQKTVFGGSHEEDEHDCREWKRRIALPCL